MANTARRAGVYHATTRTLWGLARSPELGLSKDDLYGVIYRETGKEHMHDLTQTELDRVARSLVGLKDGVQRDLAHKRTDEGGNPDTVCLRRKIYMLTGDLGWNGDNSRINGFVREQYGVERLEWATRAQCNKIIEGLKKMVARGYRREASAHGEE